MAKNITDRSKNWSQWYLDVIRAAELADYAPVRGCMVVRPNGYGIWEAIQAAFDKRFKETGHVNAYFPMLIPSSFMTREAEHVEGFSPELAVVTQAGGEELEEPLVIRPTSETVIGSMYSQWIQSYRDLPILINQWCSVMRWEKRPRLFLRTSEFLWQEGHTAHATRAEAEEETARMLGVYREVMRDVLALPVVTGEKSAGERFPGAEATYSCEAMMGDCRALQSGTSHFLGQNFARAFDIKFQDADGEVKYAWTTSWGVSTRLIGAIIMTHSDKDGLVLPPRVAPVKAAIVPISSNDELIAESLEPSAERLRQAIEAMIGVPGSVTVDRQYHTRPGDRFFRHLQRGVPIRIELGEREASAGTATIVRRDTGAKETVSIDAVPARAKEIMDDMQASLLARAEEFREAHTYSVGSYDDLKEFFRKDSPDAPTKGWAKAYFGGTPEDERRIKEETGGATIRCYAEEESNGTCIFTGKKGRLAIFGKAY